MSRLLGFVVFQTARDVAWFCVGEDEGAMLFGDSLHSPWMPDQVGMTLYGMLFLFGDLLRKGVGLVIAIACLSGRRYHPSGERVRR